MPNRMIKESIHGSEKISGLTDFQFRLWVHLITYVDDYGRGDARPAIIKGTCFPLRERVTVKDIDIALHALAGAGCVSLYEVDGKPYLYFPSWGDHQRIQTKRSKYPAPQESTVNHGESPLETETEIETETEGAQVRVFESEEMQSAFDDWLTYKRERRESYKATGEKALITRLRNDISGRGEQAVIEAIRYSMSQGWKGIYYPDDKKTAKKRDSDRVRDDLIEWMEE